MLLMKNWIKVILYLASDTQKQKMFSKHCRSRSNMLWLLITAQCLYVYIDIWNMCVSFPQSAVQTVSAAQRTSRRPSAVFVCGVERRGPCCWAITVSPSVRGATTAGTEPASVRTFTLRLKQSIYEDQRSGNNCQEYIKPCKKNICGQ